MRLKGVTVVALAVLACVVAYGQRSLAVAPDMIFFNGKIVTVDAHFTTQQAFATKDDRFVAVGDNKSVRKSLKATELSALTLTGISKEELRNQNVALSQRSRCRHHADIVGEYADSGGGQHGFLATR